MSPHWLDPETSGVLLLAKNKPALTTLSNSFGSEQPRLSFITVVQGGPSETRFSLNAKIAPHPVTPGLMSVNATQGKRARTDCEVVERFAGWTLIRCISITHRPHQLRVHLAHAGFPVAGDKAYRGKALLLSRLKPGFRLKPNHFERPLLESPRLHAEQLAFAHPVTGNQLIIQTPLPKDIAVALKYLRQHALPMA